MLDKKKVTVLDSIFDKREHIKTEFGLHLRSENKLNHPFSLKISKHKVLPKGAFPVYRTYLYQGLLFLSLFFISIKISSKIGNFL